MHLRRDIYPHLLRAISWAVLYGTRISEGNGYGRLGQFGEVLGEAEDVWVWEGCSERVCQWEVLLGYDRAGRVMVLVVEAVSMLNIKRIWVTSTHALDTSCPHHRSSILMDICAVT